MIIVDGTWVIFHCHSHVYIRNDSHQLHQCEYEFVNAKCDVGHTYCINSKLNNWYHFSFNYLLVYFQLKTNSFGNTDVSVVRMANNMYTIPAWRHQAITWANIDWSSVKSIDIYVRANSQEMPQPPIIKICLKITYLLFYQNFPGPMI